MFDEGFDLNAYLRRIGHVESRAPSLGKLSGIIACHTAAEPFENIDVFLGRPIRSARHSV